MKNLIINVIKMATVALSDEQGSETTAIVSNHGVFILTIMPAIFSFATTVQTGIAGLQTNFDNLI